MFINLFIAFFSLILIRPISITLNDGQIWEGNTGDIVEVEVEINNKFQKLQGEVTGGSD